MPLPLSEQGDPPFGGGAGPARAERGGASSIKVMEIRITTNNLLWVDSIITNPDLCGKLPAFRCNIYRGRVRHVGKKPLITDAQIAAFNLFQREKFRRVPNSERMLFLPHCLRKSKFCRGETTEDGLICKHCQPDCSINRLTTYAQARGYRCAVAPGGAMVFALIEKHHPKGIIGVACHHEIAQAAELISGGESGIEFAYLGVALSKKGCVDTMVDEQDVRDVIDLGGAPLALVAESAPAPAIPARVAAVTDNAAPAQAPVRVQAPARAEAKAPTARKRPARIRLRPMTRAKALGLGGIAASFTAVLVALLMFAPGLLAPITQQAKPGSAELMYYSYPTAKFTREPSGISFAEVRTAVINKGPGPAEHVTVRVSAVYCAKLFQPFDGGVQSLRLNRSLGTGTHEDVTLVVRVHTENDTGVLVETVMGGKVILSEYVKAVKPVFISNAGVTGYVTGIVTGREANISVQVFNERGPRAPESLKLVVESYSSFNHNTHWDSEEIVLPASLARNETWSASILVNVNELDPGHPLFVVQLYEYSGINPTDITMLEG